MRRSISLLAVALAGITLWTHVCCAAGIVTIEDARISRHIDAISKIGNLGPLIEDGYTRSAWSDEESKAIEYIRQQALEIGLSVKYDAVGNLFMRTTNNSNIIIQMGSHLDTVPGGGTFDGVAGIVCGLEAIRSVIEKGLSKDKDLELVVWRGEESATYNFAYKGSKAAFADKFPNDILARTFNGVSLEDAIRMQGYDPSYIREHKRTISQDDVDKIAAHFELHIEQGNKLENDGDDIGIVTSIRGGNRIRVELTGSFDHSGATPMGIKYRRDVNLTIGYIEVALDDLLRAYLDKGYDIVQTVGVINDDKDFNEKMPTIYNNTMTKVSGFGYFLLDIRSRSKQQREEYFREAERTIQSIAGKFLTTAKVIDLGSSDPAESLDQTLEKKIEESANAHGYKYQYMPSGAGHDAATVAEQKKRNGQAIPVGMIFIPCRQGKSHDKAEFAKTSDLRKGAEVLADTLYSLAR
jgi:hydantoinase/carbamoylase family amidase